MKYLIVTVAAVLLFSCSKSYLDVQPTGALPEEQVTTPESADGLATAAYAAIGNDFWWNPITSMWIYGSVRSDDAYKGGGSVDDVGAVNTYEQYNLTQASNNDEAPNTWQNAYKAISRANFALRTIGNLSETDFPNKLVREGEMRFLRGHMYFVLKELFNYIPYVDETVSDDSIPLISNRVYTSNELWNKIAEDFQFAIDNLPETQTQVGRANKLAAEAYLAKVRLYQAYKQGDDYTVTSVDAARLNEVVTLTTDVINSGNYSLQPDFAENFLDGYDNGPESVFAVQFSVNDGTQIGRLSMSTSLNYSLAPQYGCCWFHIPSQNMVNAFQTRSNGLPDFANFNKVALTDDDLTTNGVTVDPRLDHTVGIEGHPFKYQPDVLYDHSWERVPALYGGFGNMKEQQAATCACFVKVGPFYGSSKNIDIIRYADVLLWKAEALIKLGRQNEALPLINAVRLRAANSTERTRFANGTPPSNYKIGQYVPGTNINWTQDSAFVALQWERRIEFATESPRFFDLVRWGIAEPVLNGYLAVEKVRHPFLTNAKFTHGRDEYLPIPQREIDFTKGVYIQNPGF